MNAPNRYEIYRVVTDVEGIREGFIERVEDMNVPRLAIDEAGGFTGGHASKILCTPPIKRLGDTSLPKMLKATGMKLALVIDRDEKPKDLPKRRRKTNGQAPRASTSGEMQNMPETKPFHRSAEFMKRISKLGASKGGKRRAQELGRRARQRIATHAARARWSKRHEQKA